jgi:hypothetical protein
MRRTVLVGACFDGCFVVVVVVGPFFFVVAGPLAFAGAFARCAARTTWVERRACAERRRLERACLRAAAGWDGGAATSTGGAVVEGVALVVVDARVRRAAWRVLVVVTSRCSASRSVDDDRRPDTCPAMKRRRPAKASPPTSSARRPVTFRIPPRPSAQLPAGRGYRSRQPRSQRDLRGEMTTREDLPPGRRSGRRREMETNVKYMLIMRATDEAFEEFANVEFEEIIESMGRFNEEMISAGVLVAAEGLDEAAQGVVVDYSSQPPVVTDGPYGETKELFGGFWILDVASKEEAVEWAKRAPMAGPGLKTEIRRVTSIEEFPQDNPWIQKERAWRESTGQL